LAIFGSLGTGLYSCCDHSRSCAFSGGGRASDLCLEFRSPPRAILSQGLTDNTDALDAASLSVASIGHPGRMRASFAGMISALPASNATPQAAPLSEQRDLSITSPMISGLRPFLPPQSFSSIQPCDRLRKTDPSSAVQPTASGAESQTTMAAVTGISEDAAASVENAEHCDGEGCEPHTRSTKARKIDVRRIVRRIVGD